MPVRLPVDHLLGQRMKAPLMKSVNGIRLLNLIREQGPISRAALAKVSCLSKPTVSSLVDGLIQSGLVVEEGRGKSGARGGKIPKLVKFNAQSGLLVAAEVGPAFIRAVLTDLEGVVLDRRCLPTSVEAGAAAVLERLDQALRELLARARPARGRLRTIAIATYGRVDVRSGRVLDIGNIFNWHNVDVRRRLEPVYRVPVFVDNDVNMAALGELHHGAAAGARNFVLIRLGTGIGCGVVLDGHLYHGSHWAAGEIAHAALAESAGGADWDPRGYLENVVAEDLVLSRVRDAGLDGGTDPLATAIAAAAAGHPAAREIIDRLASHLGLAATLVAAAYDPALIVLQGRLFQVLFEQVESLVRRLIPWGVKVTLSTLGDEAVLLGTTIAARSHAYERIAKELNA